MSLQLIEPCLVFDELPKQEREQLFVVARLSQVLPETLYNYCHSVKPFSARKRTTNPLQSLLDAHLLRTDEAVHSDFDRQINIIRPHVFSQSHLRTGLRHTYHTLQMPDSNGVGAGSHGFTTQVREELGKFLLVEVVQFGPDLLPCVHDVLAENILRDDL